MFAFALADEKTGELFLARDPLGIKPLLLPAARRGRVFASELKALVAAVGPELRIEPGALVASMLYYWVPEQFCAIEGVPSSPPVPGRGCRPDGRWTSSTTGRSRTWRRAAEAGPPRRPAPVIEDSVAAHLVADVPVSSFLSGGLDSSIVTVLAHRAAQEIDAYTITFRPEDQRLEAMPDDAVYARKVAAQFGMKLHEIEISPDIVDLLPRMVDVLDEPIGDPAAINTLLMCEAARERGVKVILSGMGADELFGGYRKHLACVMASRYGRLPGAPRAARAVRGRPAPGHPRRPGPALRPVGQAVPDLRRAARGAAVPAQLHTLRPGRPGRPAEPRPRGQVDQVIDGHREIYTDNSCTTRSTACAWPTRGCSCPASTSPIPTGPAWPPRSRSASRSWIRSWPRRRSPSRAATRSGTGRARSRSSRPRENWLPHEIVYRPKASFSAPLRAWVRNDLQEVINDVLVRGELVGSGMIRGGALDRLIQDERAGREDNAKQIWQLLTMELWYRNARSMGVAA